jgi:hypothetical protein
MKVRTKQKRLVKGAVIITAFLFLNSLLTGCSTNREKIVFGDEQDAGTAMTNAVATPAPRRLDRTDELEIEMAVYGDLLQRHFWDGGEYTAVFLEDTAAEVEAVQKKFPDHLPPIKANDRLLMRSGRTPLDKDTERPAMVLSVEVLEFKDDTVEAAGHWFAGDAMKGTYTYSMIKSGDDWVIEDVR